MKSFKFCFVAVFLILFTSSLKSVPAYPFPKTIVQSDGTEITVILKGDEFHNYYTTDDGYLLIKDKKGIFNYGIKRENGKIIDTRVKARNSQFRTTEERTFIQSIEQNPDFSTINAQNRAAKAPKSFTNTAAPQKFPKTGSPKTLVILVNFADLTFVTPMPRLAFDSLLNFPGYSSNEATGSARDYFVDNSMGVFTPQFDVVGPYTLPKNLNFYGGNDASGLDLNPVQMVVDACSLANAAGVDFSIYDTDNNGIVDNVFIYFAGHNEAEHAPDDRIWPHRWSIYPTDKYPGGNYTGTESSVTFDGKIIFDYACSSELRGAGGEVMAGIGTFAHEFGHVLGLADMYATNGASHHTLSFWNIMDDGAYVNKGRTPPAYNSFERFQLGFLIPTVLEDVSQNYTLDTLTTSNQAYLISPPDNDNQGEASPFPTEFFLFENRQKAGWDTYIPGHGMLIYRINYNESDWDDNSPNNDPNNMGVDIMEADGIGSNSTLEGDPFPGANGVTTYNPVQRSGNSLNYELTGITENDGIISFAVNKLLLAPVVPTDLSTIVKNESEFTAVWEPVADATSYEVDVYIKTESGEPQVVFSENFDSFAAGSPNSSANNTDVSDNLDNYTLISGWSGAKIFQAGGSVKIGTSSQLGFITTPELNLPAHSGNYTLNFDAMAWSGDANGMKIFVNEALFHTVTDLNNTDYTFKSYSLPNLVGNNATKIRFEGSKTSKGRFLLDNLGIRQKQIKTPIQNSPFTTSETSLTISNLLADTLYYYSVRAMNDTQLSAYSEEVGPIILTRTGIVNPEVNTLTIRVKNGKILFYASEGEIVEVYNQMGQKLLQSNAKAGENEVAIDKKGVLIVKVGDRANRVVL